MQALHTFIMDIDVGEKVQAEVELFKILEAVEMYQGVIRLALAASALIPHWTRQIKLSKRRKPGQSNQLFRLNERPGKIYTGDYKISVGQLCQIANWLGGSVRGDAAFEADDPLRDRPLALLRR